jgi:hypothetical protein
MYPIIPKPFLRIFFFTSCPVWSNHPKKASNPPISNQRVGIVTQHTIHRPHSPHSAQHLLILLSTSFQRFISNEQVFACFKVGPCRNGIRHQKTFRRGGGPPKEKWKNDILDAHRCCTRFRKDVNHLKPASVCTVRFFLTLRKKNSNNDFFSFYNRRPNQKKYQKCCS